MEIRISQFHFDLFLKILNSCQSSLFGSEILICFLEFLIGIRISKKITFLSEFLVGIRNSMLSFLWGSEFLKVFWTSFWGSEFLKVFWTSLWGSEFLRVFWTSFMGIRISQSFLDFFMGIRISECFLDFFYGDQNFWMFFGLLYGDQNSWVLFGLLLWGSEFLTVFLPNFHGNLIRNSEFSLETFSVIRD